MTVTSIVSKWRGNLPALRERLRHIPAQSDTFIEDGFLLGQVYAAEEFCRLPLTDNDITNWTQNAQDSFNTAVAELVQFWLANPDFAKSWKDGSSSRNFSSEIPWAVNLFWTNYTTGKLPGDDEQDFVIGRFTR